MDGSCTHELDQRRKTAEKNMSKDYTLLDSLRVLGRWKKQIIFTTLAVAILSIVGALMMDNYYQSTATFYAAHADLANPEPVGGSDSYRYIYGTNDDLDRLFSVAQSTQLKTYLVQKFDLYEHYELDSTTLKGQAKMAKTLDKLYTTVKTRYDAMSLSVEDKDPQLAKQIVTAAREKLSENAQQIIKTSQQQSLNTTADNIDAQLRVLHVLDDSLQMIKKKFKIFDSATQGEVYAQMLASTEASLQQKSAQLRSMKSLNITRDSINKVTALVAGLKERQQSLTMAVTNYNEGILDVKTLEQARGRITDELSLDRERYKRLKASYDAPFTALHIVELESTPVEKSRPKRSIIVLGLTMLAFLLSCLGAIIIDATKEINWRDIYNG